MSRHPYALRMALLRERRKLARLSASPFPVPYVTQAATLARVRFLQSELAFALTLGASR